MANSFAGDNANATALNVFAVQLATGSPSIPDTLTGQVFDQNGNGVPDVLVYLDLQGSGVLSSGDPTVVTDASGQYTFVNLAPGAYTVQPMPPAGFATTGSGANGIPVLLPAPGLALGGLNFNLRRPSTWQSQSGLHQTP